MRNLCLGLVLVAVICRLPSPALAVSFDWATVGNPGNAPDDTGFGAVNYTYRISKYEVTNSQYTEFLNAVAGTDTYGLYNTDMGSMTWGGITRSGSSGSYSYSVKPDAVGQGPGGADGDDYTYANKPVVYVSFFDAMRFTNWLHNGQGSGDTETGVYTIGSGTDEVRDPNATFFIPSEDEWYKAAYYDPNANAGSGGYYDYPTSTDTTPNNNLPSADTGNSANFYDSGFTTGSSSYPMTDVGAYSLSASPYGTFDQGGSVWEWNEAVIGSSYPLRGFRAGTWGHHGITLRSDIRGHSVPSLKLLVLGFRVATVPEPTTATLALAALCLAMGRRTTRP